MTKRSKAKRPKLTKEHRRRREYEEGLKMAEGAKRKVHDLFGFWRACPQGRCRRAQACLGDIDTCNQRCWPLVPEAEKVGFHACIKARGEGHSPDECLRIWAEEKRAFLAGEHLERIQKLGLHG